MNRPPAGASPGSVGLDDGLRETATNSVVRWRRRLDGGNATPTDLGLIVREAQQLRTLAAARGATGLVERLDRMAGLANAPAIAMAAVVHELASFIGLAPPPLAMGAPPALRTVGLDVHSGVQPPPVVGSAAPVPAPRVAPEAPAAASMIAPPSLLQSRIAAPSMLEPPRIDPSPVNPSAPPPPVLENVQTPGRPQGKGPSNRPPFVATMLSGGKKGLESSPEDAAKGGGPANSPSIALPESVGRAPAPPKLLAGTFLGFRAFGNKGQRGPLQGAPDEAPRGGGLLGLRKPRAVSSLPVPAGGFAERARIVPGVSTAEQRRKRGGSSPSPTAGSAPIAIPPWMFLVGAGFAFLAVVTVVAIVAGRHRRDDVRPAASSPASSSSTSTMASVVATPRPADSSSPDEQKFDKFLHQGTPQLRALLEAQSKAVMNCKNEPAACGRGWTAQSRDMLAPVDSSNLPLSPEPDQPLPGWLRSLKLPADVPIRDEPALRAVFDFNTKNIAGRQSFQSKLFECSAYSDIFESTLLKYDAPRWLGAVVYQESGCNHLATSEVGARGLWQFMPESARAYGLRVVEGEVDERLNPVKSTDAAIHFLTDLQRLLGAWDLALAAYNVGPLAVLARLTQVGHSSGFWELAHAGLLPQETAGYVPAIEADALVLANLVKLNFTPYGKRLESTAEIIVKPGTRLSLLARAASTTTLHIRDLNPEFLRDTVPEGETAARVPDSEAHRAQAFIDSWSPADTRDSCVPPEFDWGAQQFETSRYAKACAAAAHNGQ